MEPTQERKYWENRKNPNRGPWYGQDFGKLFGNQEAPSFSGVLCIN